MPVYIYSFNTTGFNDSADNTITVTTEDNLSTISLPGDPDYQGYRVTAIAGKFNGQDVAGLLGPGGTYGQDYYPGPPFGQENAGFFDNTIFPDDIQGDNGSSFGVDNLGLGFQTADGAHYGLYVQDGAFRYESAGIPANPVTLNDTNAPCFLTGTLIRVRRAGIEADVAVENLAIGDTLLTGDGEIRPVVWIGRRTIAAFFADPVRCYPIRIAAGALAEAVPARDLFLSPDHALFLDGALVNGSTVTRVTSPGERFIYYHVETQDQAVILAEGAAAESFVNNTTRRNFDNYTEYEALFGPQADYEAMVELDEPRAMSARQVPAVVRTRLAERAAVLSSAEAAAA